MAHHVVEPDDDSRLSRRCGEREDLAASWIALWHPPQTSADVNPLGLSIDREVSGREAAAPATPTARIGAARARKMRAAVMLSSGVTKSRRRAIRNRTPIHEGAKIMRETRSSVREPRRSCARVLGR